MTTSSLSGNVHVSTLLFAGRTIATSAARSARLGRAWPDFTEINRIVAAFHATKSLAPFEAADRQTT